MQTKIYTSFRFRQCICMWYILCTMVGDDFITLLVNLLQ